LHFFKNTGSKRLVNKKKAAYYAWSHSQIACETLEDEKHKNAAFGKFNHDTQFTEQCIMPPPLFSEQGRHTPLLIEQWSM